MQRHFRSARLLAILLSATLLSGCYSAEFRPAADYANLRREVRGEVELLHYPPDYPYHSIGTLVVRDYAGNLNDPGFRAMVRREARNRGAEGAYISRLSSQQTTRFESTTVGRSGRPQGGAPPTISEVGGQLWIIEIVLFNSIETAEKPKRIE